MSDLDLCKALWSSKVYRAVKAYVANRICKYDYDAIAENLWLRREHVPSYVLKGDKLLQKYSDIIMKASENCQKMRKGKLLVCESVYHNLFIRRVIQEYTNDVLLSRRFTPWALAIHSYVFPLFYLLYNGHRRAYSKVKVRLKGNKWYVSVPSAVYTFYVIAMLEPKFKIIMSQKVEGIIKKLAKKDVRQLVLTNKDAQLAREIVKMAISARAPVW